MDPHAAVGLASNIIQFIDFSSKLFITVKELHQNDQTASNTELQDLADKLILACQNLVDVPPNGQGSSRPTPQIPPALNAVSDLNPPLEGTTAAVLLWLSLRAPRTSPN